MKAQLAILIFFLVLFFSVSNASAYTEFGAPSEFGNETTSTCFVGGDDGIVNCTGSAKFGGPMNMTNNNITEVDSGFFTRLGSLIKRIRKLFVVDIDMSGNLEMNGNEIFNIGNLNLTQDINLIDKNWLVPAPILNNHTTNKKYVDDATSSTAFDFFFNNDTSDISGDYNMTESDLERIESEVDSASLGEGTFNIFNWTTKVGQPEFNKLRQGIYDVHIHLFKTGIKPVTITPKLYNVSSDGSAKTLLVTFETSGLILTVGTDYNLHGILTDPVRLGDGERLRLELEATVGATGSNVVITAQMEGTTDSHLTVETSTNAFEKIFIRRDGTNTLTGNWRVGDFNISGINWLKAVYGNFTNICIGSVCLSSWDSVNETDLALSINTTVNIQNLVNNSINSSNFWDDLDDPSDINTADLTDDNTFVKVTGDTMTGNLKLDDGVGESPKLQFYNANDDESSIYEQTDGDLYFSAADGFELAGNSFRMTTLTSCEFIQTDGSGILSCADDEVDLNVNRSNYWDDLDIPTDISNSEFWYNHTLATFNTWDDRWTDTFNATYDSLTLNVSLNYSKIVFDTWDARWIETFNQTYEDFKLNVSRNWTEMTFDGYNSTWDNNWVNVFAYNHTLSTFNTWNTTWDESGWVSATFTPLARILTAGSGLTGGGTLEADRTFNVGAGTGITVNADDVAISAPYLANISKNYTEDTFTNWDDVWRSTFNATYEAINTTANIQNLINGTVDALTLNGKPDSHFMPDNTSVVGNFDFNGGWTNEGFSIVGGDIYAQTGYFYNISAIEVTQLNINGSLIPAVGFDDTFDVGSSSLRWRDLFLSGEVHSNGTGDNYFLGDVGIGTATPTHKLNVVGDINYTGSLIGKFGDLVSEPNPYAGNAIRLKGTGDDVDIVLGDVSGYFSIWDVTDTAPVFSIDNQGDIVTTGGAIFNENSADRNFRIESNGNEYMLFVDGGENRVGIGTGSPGANLELQDSGENSQTKLFIETYNDQAAFTPEMRFTKSHTDTADSLIDTIDTEILGQIVFQGVDSGQNKDVGVIIKAVQDGAAGNFLPTNLIFNTYSSTAANTNQFVLHNDGNVGIGTADPDGELEVVGKSGATTDLLLSTKDKDGTDDIRLFFYGLGDQVATNQEFMIAGWDTSETAYRIVTGKANSGSARPIYLAAEAGSVNQLYLNTDGNVGIGTTSPRESLEINGALRATGALKVSETGVTLSYEAGDQVNIIGYGPSEAVRPSFFIRTRGSAGASGIDNIEIQPDGDILLNQAGIGNVGIGTASPDTKLQIETAAGGATANYAIIRYNNSATSWDAGVGATAGSADFIGNFYFHDGTATRMLIQNTSGNVGIGTTSPGALLDVAGKIKGTSAEIASTFVGLIFNETDEAGAAGLFRLEGTSGVFQIARNTAAGGDFSTRTIPFILQADDDAIFSGNVGIGTASPINSANYATLEISDTTGGQILWSDDGVFKGFAFNDASDFHIGSAGDLIFKAGSSGSTNEYMRILSTGNVGIGETSPNALLEVSGAPDTGYSSTEKGQFLVGGTSVSMGIGQYTASPYATWFQGLDRRGGSTSTFPLVFNPVGGNVGIGTTNPQSSLDVSGSASQQIRVNSSGGVASFSLWQGNVNEILLRGSGGDSYINAGKFGIGTDSPGEELEVVGDINSTGGDICITGGNCLSTVTSTGGGWTDDGADVRLTTISDNVGIGTSSPVATLNVDGNVTFTMINGENFTAGILFVNNTNVGIGTVSPTHKLNVVGNQNLTGNLTLGDKIIFAFGEIIDNLVNGWIRINGNLNVSGAINATGDICTVGGSCLSKLNSKLSYWSATGADFLADNPDVDDVSYDIAGNAKGSVKADADNIRFNAPVHLPHGAVVTAINVTGNAAAEAELFNLVRNDFAGGVIELMATSFIGTEDTTISNAAIDNSAYHYWIRIASIDTNDEVYSARITYTTDYD